MDVKQNPRGGINRWDWADSPGWTVGDGRTGEPGAGRPAGCCGTRASRWLPGPRTAGEAGVVIAIRGRSRAFSHFHGKPLPVS